MDYGEFDSDSLALSKRVQAYEKNSNNNLNDYVLSQSAVKVDEFVSSKSDVIKLNIVILSY